MSRHFRPACVVLMLLAALAHGDEATTISETEKPEVAALLADGNGLLSANDTTGAVQVFRKALVADVGNRSAKYGICAAFIKMGKYEEFNVILESLLAQYPNDYVLKNNAAWLYATAGAEQRRDFSKAINLARDALLLAPQDYQVWNTLAEAHYGAANYDKALQAALQATRLARSRGASSAQIDRYDEQLRKCMEAAEAFRLME